MAYHHHRSYISQNDERFSFQTKGTFKVSLGLEYPFMAVVSLLALAGIIATIVFVPYLFPEADEKGKWIWGTISSNQSFMLMAALVELIIISAVVILYLLLIRIILNGKHARYSADSYRFSVVVDKEQDVFLYKDVTAVIYDPIRFVNKIRGYVVQVRTVQSRTPYTYRVLLSKMVTSPNPDVTPFLILEERAGLRDAGSSTVFKRDEENMKNVSLKGELAPDLPAPSQTASRLTDDLSDEEYLQWLRSNNEFSNIRRPDTAKPVQKPDTDSMTDEEYLQYLNSKELQPQATVPDTERPVSSVASDVMPSISLKDMSVQQAAVMELLSTPEVTEENLHPAANDTSPKADIALSPVTESNSYYSARRVGSQFTQKLGEGSFKVPFKYEKPVKLVILIVAFFGILDCLIDNIVAALLNEHSNALILTQNLGHFLLFAVLWLGCAALFYWFTEIGTVVNYRADGEKIIFYDNHNHTRSLRYMDVIGVKYYPLMRRKVQIGWNVNIITVDDTIIYRYHFQNSKTITPPEETPFHIIEEHIPDRNSMKQQNNSN